MKCRQTLYIHRVFQYCCCTFLILIACSKEKKIPCKSDFRIEAPIEVNYKASRMTLNDTLQFKIEIPFKNLNRITGDSVNLSLFEDLWGGFTIDEYIKDSNLAVPGGGLINLIPARLEFRYLSKINQFQIPDNSGSPNKGALFFRFAKSATKFNLILEIIPKKKGTFLFIFLPSGFRDAECFNKFSHRILSYNNELYTYLIEEAIGKPIMGGNPYNPELYIIRVE
jgi:hypothetical protein